MPPCIRSSSALLQCCWVAPKQVLPTHITAHFPHALCSYLKLCKWILQYNEGWKALYKELRSVTRVGILSCKDWRNLRSQTESISDLTTHSSWQGFFLPSTFSFMVQECTEWAFQCWSAKFLMVRSYCSPLKCTGNGLKQRDWFLRQCLNLEAAQQSSFLCW